MMIYQTLLQSHPTRLSLEANTPATSVTHDPSTTPSHPYSIHTPRGTIKAKHVIHCTNGYTGHLLPSLRGPLFPYRGTMTVQDLGTQLPNQGHNTSWSLHHAPIQDSQSGLTKSGTHYLQQNPKSGYFFFGGEKTTAEAALTSDDSEQNDSSIQDLREKLPNIFGLSQSLSNKLVSSWTGVMGFTADDLPLVGNLSADVTTRHGNGEWIAAGFNGMGMSLCILAGEAIAKMVLGEDVSEWLPGAFCVTSSRLQSHLTVERSEEVMSSYWPSFDQALRLMNEML